jgi:LuxR family transcriptional regulator, maltose regulon positive regulatory protein
VVRRHGLFTRLDRAARITEVAAPAGSGKTVLLRSWIGESGLADRAEWVQARQEERDSQRFWISVADALRSTAPGSALVRSLTAAPDLDGWAIVERLLTDLASLEDRLWLVIGDCWPGDRHHLPFGKIFKSFRTEGGTSGRRTVFMARASVVLPAGRI